MAWDVEWALVMQLKGLLPARAATPFPGTNEVVIFHKAFSYLHVFRYYEQVFNKLLVIRYLARVIKPCEQVDYLLST